MENRIYTASAAIRHVPSFRNADARRVRVRDAGAHLAPRVRGSRARRRDATYSTAATSTLRYVGTRNKFQARNWNSLLLAADMPRTCGTLVKKVARVKRREKYFLRVAISGYRILLNMGML